MAGFIAAQRAEYGVPHAVACRALGVSQAWFYKWRHGDGSPQRARRRALAMVIVALFARHRGTYGSPRITADLREMGWRVSQNTVAAVMAEQRLRARARRRRRSTTRPGKAAGAPRTCDRGSRVKHTAGNAALNPLRRAATIVPRPSCASHPPLTASRGAHLVTHTGRDMIGVFIRAVGGRRRRGLLKIAVRRI